MRKFDLEERLISFAVLCIESGGCTTWTGPWNSGLKLHAAGCLCGRGSSGGYWSSTQNNAPYGWYLDFSSGSSSMYDYSKAGGFSLPCLSD